MRRPNPILDHVYDLFETLLEELPIPVRRLHDLALPDGGTPQLEGDFMEAIDIWCGAGIMDWLPDGRLTTGAYFELEGDLG